MQHDQQKRAAMVNEILENVHCNCHLSIITFTWIELKNWFSLDNTKHSWYNPIFEVEMKKMVTGFTTVNVVCWSFCQISHHRCCYVWTKLHHIVSEFLSLPLIISLFVDHIIFKLRKFNDTYLHYAFKNCTERYG
jgi:hypothetical protein